VKEHVEEGKIALLAGEDLEAGQMSAVAFHVSRCASCSAILESYRQRRQAMAACRDLGIRAGEFVEIRQSVLARLPARKPRLGSFPWFHIAPLQAGVLATLLLAAATIGTYAWKRAHELQPAGTAVQVNPIPEAAARPSVGAPAEFAAKPIPARKIARNPDRQTSRREPPAVIHAAPAPVLAAVDPQTQAHQPAVPDDVAMKLETSDPSVIIIWLASPKGAGR